MMGEGSNVDRIYKTGSMEDVGTRFQFLTDLYDVWKAGLDILERYDKHTPGYEDKKRELEISLRMLGYHLEKDYKEDEYKKAIDLLPKDAARIEDENSNK